MKLTEVPKHEADIQRGKVLMALEGSTDAVEALVEALKAEGYPSTQCADVGDNEGEIIEYFVIQRQNLADFKQTYKTLKA